MSTQNFLPSSSGENSLGLPDLKFSDGYFNSGSFESGLITEAFYLRGRLYPYNFLTVDGLVEESSDINIEKYLNFPKWKSGINEDQTLSSETIYRNENVGIGIDSPSSRLHVEGNFLVTGDFSVENFIKISNLDSQDFSLNDEDLIEKTNDAIASIYQESPTSSLLKNDGLNLVRLSSFHPKIVSEFSSLNNGRVYIQSIELDRYGHITGLSDSRELFTDTHVRKEKVEDLIESTILNGNEVSIVKNSKGRLVVNSEHPFINSCGDSFNSDRTYLQNLFFDEYGHCVSSSNSFEDFEAIDVIQLITAQGNMSSSLSNNTLTLSSTHPNVSPVASDSSNPSRTYIQNIELDEFGHVSSYSSNSETLTIDETTDEILRLNPPGDNIEMVKIEPSNSILISSSHESISSSVSTNNAGRTYIKDISLDQYGHILNISTYEETWLRRLDSEIVNLFLNSVKEGSSLSTTESLSKIFGPLDDLNSFQNTKSIHLQETSDPISFQNHGNGGLIKQVGFQFSNSKPIFNEGALKMDHQSSFAAFDWRDGQFAAGQNFTIDFWLYKDQNIAGKNESLFGNFSSSIFSTANWRILYDHINADGIIFVHDPSNQVLKSGPIPLGQWNHLAVERFNNDLYMYLNGVIVSTETSVSKALNAFGISADDAWGPLGYSNKSSFQSDFPASIFEMGNFPGMPSGFTGLEDIFKILES